MMILSEESYREIPLTQGQVAIVNTADYERLMQWKWFAAWAPHVSAYYAARTERLEGGKVVQVKMHRTLLGLEYGNSLQGDHINGKTLDNRRSNLRVALLYKSRPL